MFHPNGPTFMELARQAMSSTRHGYDLLAPKFDFTPFRTPDFVLERVAAWLEETRQESPSINDSIDICCGTGAGVEMLATACGGRIVGVDFSEGMLTQARENLANPGGGERDLSVEWLQHDVLDLPFENRFDLAVCFGAQGHFLPPEQETLLDQVTKVLKPGGRFIFVTTHMPRFFTPAHQLARGFNAAMRIRNLFFRPPFIMYYLTFLLPEVRKQLERRGFEVREITAFEKRLAPLKLVDAILKE